MTPAIFNQTEALADQQHVVAELALPAEIIAVGAAPVVEAAVAFAFVVGEARIDLAETTGGYLGGFDHAGRCAAAVEHDPALARRRQVRLVRRTAGRGLDTADHEIEQIVGELRPVAECE